MPLSFLHLTFFTTNNNRYNLREVTTRSLADECAEGEPAIDDEALDDIKGDLAGTVMMMEGDDNEAADHANNPLWWYLTLRGCEKFYDLHGHYPGSDDRELAQESDAKEVHTLALAVANRYGLDSEEIKKHYSGDHAKEATRWFAAEVRKRASV